MHDPWTLRNVADYTHTWLHDATASFETEGITNLTVDDFRDLVHFSIIEHLNKAADAVEAQA